MDSSNLRLGNSKKSEKVGVVGVVLETLVQDVFRLHELVLQITLEDEHEQAGSSRWRLCGSP